jgi:hypothetical protein
MANPRPLKLTNAALLQTLKIAILEQNRLEFQKSPNFGPQNADFSKIWPSSRFGLAMAGVNVSCTFFCMEIYTNF